MSTESPGDKLGDTHNVTVLVRLVLNQHGNLRYGEIVDQEGRPQGRFQEWSGIAREIKDWLADQPPQDSLDFPPDASTWEDGGVGHELLGGAK